ncbi:MAG: hypothetical protein AB7J19_19860, partial [Beijerinckiaceae bacterium]
MKPAIARTVAAAALTAAFSAVSNAPAAAQAILVNSFAPHKSTIHTGVLLPWIEAVSKAPEGRVKGTIPPQ